MIKKMKIENISNCKETYFVYWENNHATTIVTSVAKFVVAFGSQNCFLNDSFSNRNKNQSGIHM